MHDSLTPLGGLVPMLHMMLNCVFGGKGVGLMNMVMYVILAVFICGLMVGRTPEYLNKKIEGREMKLVALVIFDSSTFNSWIFCIGCGNTGRNKRHYEPGISRTESGSVRVCLFCGEQWFRI